jgi:hypothetical protein
MKRRPASALQSFLASACREVQVPLHSGNYVSERCARRRAGHKKGERNPCPWLAARPASSSPSQGRTSKSTERGCSGLVRVHAPATLARGPRLSPRRWAGPRQAAAKVFADPAKRIYQAYCTHCPRSYPEAQYVRAPPLYRFIYLSLTHCHSLPLSLPSVTLQSPSINPSAHARSGSLILSASNSPPCRQKQTKRHSPVK